MDNVMRDRLQKVANQRKVCNKAGADRASISRLQNLISQFCKTIFIGNIAKFEAYFGKVWGHGLKEDECMDNQLDMCEVWEQCRDEILNASNTQLRLLIKNLEMFDVNYKGIKTEFRPQD